MNTNYTPIATDVSDPDDLPNELVVRNGLIVNEKTGLPPTFPKVCRNGFKMEGTTVSVVPRADLVRLMKRNRARRKLIQDAIAILSNITPEAKQ